LRSGLKQIRKKRIFFSFHGVLCGVLWTRPSLSVSHTLWGMNFVHKCHPLKAVSENITYSFHALDIHAKKCKSSNNYTKYGMNN